MCTSRIQRLKHCQMLKWWLIWQIYNLYLSWIPEKSFETRNDWIYEYKDVRIWLIMLLWYHCFQVSISQLKWCKTYSHKQENANNFQSRSGSSKKLENEMKMSVRNGMKNEKEEKRRQKFFHTSWHPYETQIIFVHLV